MTSKARARGKKLDELASRLKLTPKERRFAEALAVDPERNQTAAARKAGYKSDQRRHGSLVAARGNVRAYLAAILEEAHAEAQEKTADAVMSVRELWERLTIIARSDMADYTETAEGEPGEDGKRKSDFFLLRLKTPFASRKGAAVAALKYNSDGLPEIKLRDSQQALSTLARMYGLLRDKVEVTGEDGGPVVIREVIGGDE